MGLGDDLLVTSFAESEKMKYPDKQIVIGNFKEKKIYDSLIYKNNPNITPANKVEQSKPTHFIDYHTGNRPYIDYKKSNSKNYKWNMKFSPIPGKLYFSETELSNAKKIIASAKNFWKKNNKSQFKGIIFFESTSTKIEESFFYYKIKNLDWGESNWQKLILKLKDNYLIIQSKHKKSKKYSGTYYSAIDFDFRTACAIIDQCDLFIGPHGGFVHAAAALQKKAVQYLGGWIHPKVIGYGFHENIYFNHSLSPCGAIGYICDHCEQARKNISVQFFYEKVISKLTS